MITDGVVDAWEGRPVADWQIRWCLPQLVALSDTSSTNDVARSLAEEDAPAGLLVMSEHQTAGRGRMRREWSDAPGRSLLLSFLLRPAAVSGEAAPGTAPLRVGMAVARALHESTGIDARLKWPNDVIVPGAGKLAGILCEAITVGRESAIIAGIGINVLQRDGDWPDELRDTAVSVAQVLGDAGTSDLVSPVMHGLARPTVRTCIMDAVTQAMHPLFTQPLVPLDEHELQQYRALDTLRGSDVTAVQDRVQGRAAGIAPNGALLVEAGGRMHCITSGSVRATVPATHFRAHR